MSKMTIVHLGMVVFAICLTTQVVSQNSTVLSMSNSTSNSTAMPVTHSSSGNSTSRPTGAGVSLHAGTFPVLIPVITAATLLQRSCC